jgi:hypothetical protein
MKNLLTLEEFAQFLLGIWLFSTLNYSWWWFPVLLFLPDLSMIGYLWGSKTGAWIYNFFHHKLLAVTVLLIGFYIKENWIFLSGIILFSHASIDRIFGYGLKYKSGFQETHLGKIGKNHE